MEDQFLQSMASAAHWRQEGTKCKSLPQYRWSGISSTPIATPADLDGIQIRYFSCPLVRRLYWAPALGRALHFELGKLDVVHLHSVFLWPTWAAARAARKARVPYVLSPRGMLVKDLIARRSRLTKSAWIHLIERSNVEQAAALHLTSQLEGTEIERFGWRLPRLAIIPNAIDEPLSQNGKIASDVEAITSQQPLVLFLGRLSWKKGLDRLLRAFALTPAGILAVVGTDDENFAPRLAKLAAELRIADRVRILPRTVIGSEKERLFAAARLFVLPSYSENFGNTVLEAMRRGVPIVVTPEVGAAEIVRTSGAGLVVAGGHGAAQFGHPPVDRRPRPRPIDGRGRTTTRRRAFHLGSGRYPDGRFVQQLKTSSP
jgi:glycosyltransferase involved in cell wall biosynthesis